MVQPILIGFAGHFGAGKDTAIQAIQTYDSAAVRKAFADPIYVALYNLDPVVRYACLGRPVHLKELVLSYGWDRAKRKYPEIRRLLQHMGTEVGRKLWGSQFWVQQLFATWDPTIPTLISGVRFPEEVDAIRKRGGVMWWVVRPNLELEDGHNHESEHRIKPEDGDYIVHNNDITQFQELVVGLYDEFCGTAAVN